jgi:uncharacterized protein (TIGR03083 family)
VFVQAILSALGEQHSELAALLDPLDDAFWQRPTRCEGWSVADVTLHLAQTDELTLASAPGRFAEELGGDGTSCPRRTQARSDVRSGQGARLLPIRRR